MTGEKTLVAGVNWLRENQTGTVTWNCFAEGNYTGDRPWGDWGSNFGVSDGSVGLLTNGTRWGFFAGQHQVAMTSGSERELKLCYKNVI
jgi:hypothetical protein